MADETDTARRIIGAAMHLAAAKGWGTTSLADIAAEAGVSLADLYQAFSSKADILAGLMRRADAAMLEGGSGGCGDGTETTRDRLFDTIMRRFDALRPYRVGLAAVVRDLRRAPASGLMAGPAFLRSMAWVLRAAGIDADRAGGGLKAAALGGIYLNVFRVWLDDDTADQSRTMAALDRRLRQAEPIANFCCRTVRATRPSSAPAPGAATP